MDDTQQTEIEQLKQQLEASKRLYEITLANEIRWMLKHEKATQELEAAWGIIANAGGGDWELESPEWQEAAKAWRGRHFANSTTSLHNESSTTGELLEPAAQLLRTRGRAARRYLPHRRIRGGFSLSHGPCSSSGVVSRGAISRGCDLVTGKAV